MPRVLCVSYVSVLLDICLRYSGEKIRFRIARDAVARLERGNGSIDYRERSA